MADITDKLITICPCCSQARPELVERQRVNVQLNGPGGQFPAVEIGAGDRVRAAFAKNGSAFAEIHDDYLVARNAPAGHRLVVYCQLIIREEPIPQEV
jgi:hypothetical protein